MRKFLLSIIIICVVCADVAWSKKREPVIIEQGVQSMSVISFNMAVSNSANKKWRSRRDAIVSMANSERPQIIATQEGLSGQLRYLDSQLNSYDRVGKGRDGGHMGEHCAIYYDADRMELLENGTFWLSETPNKPSKGWDADKKRIVTWACFYDMMHQKKVYVFNTHLDHLGRESREESVKLLKENISKITNYDGAIIVCGDFNALPTAPELEPITGIMTDARSNALLGDSHPTFNGWGRAENPKVIDHIYVYGARPIRFSTLTSGTYGTEYISDHYPVKALIIYDKK